MGSMNALLMYLFAFSCVFAVTDFLEHRRFLHDELQLFWTVNPAESTIEAALLSSSSSCGWVAFGLSESGTMNGADFAVCTFGSHPQVHDYFSTGAGKVKIDDPRGQDWKLLDSFHNSSHCACRIRRKLLTCDDEDDWNWSSAAPSYIVWARGSGTDLHYHGSSGSSRGSSLFSLIMPDEPSKSALSYEEQWVPLQAPPIAVPAQPTTYICTSIRMQAFESSLFHIVQWEANVTSDLIHHIFVYRCPQSDLEKFLPYNSPTECPVKPASCEAHLAWGMGQGSLKIPNEAGVPFGGEACSLQGGDDSECFSFFLLEYHYNNPAMLPNVIDTSAIQLRVTSRLREHDMGVFLTGPSFPNIVIPPRQKQVLISAECPATCTSRFPEQGLTVVASQLHMHGLGRRIWLQLVRNGQELEEIAHKDFYDFSRQSLNYHVPFRKVLPGDRLIVNCEFDSSHRDEETRGGWSSTDEMCVAYLGYYPRMKSLSYCNVAFDDSSKCYCGPSSEQGRINTSASWDPQHVVSLPELSQFLPASNQKKKICNAMAMEEVNKNSNFSHWSYGAVLTFAILLSLNNTFRILLSQLDLAFRSLTLQLQRSVEMYCTINVALTTALLFLGIGSIKSKIWNFEAVVLEDSRFWLDITVFGTSLVGYTFLFEMVYRIKYDSTVSIHHVLTAIIISLLAQALRDSLNPFYLWIGVLLSLNAALEQPTYIALILYRLRKNVPITLISLKAAVIWTLISKTWVLTLTMKYLNKHYPQRPSFSWLDSQSNRLQIVLADILPLACGALYLVQLRCSWIMWRLYKRVESQENYNHVDSNRENVESVAPSPVTAEFPRLSIPELESEELENEQEAGATPSSIVINYALTTRRTTDAPA